MSDSLNETIIAFHHWSEPWRFHDDVARSLKAGADIQTFEEVWNEANNANHWTSPDLASCARRAEESILRNFSNLTMTAASAVARAAAYQWR